MCPAAPLPPSRSGSARAPSSRRLARRSFAAAALVFAAAALAACGCPPSWEHDPSGGIAVGHAGAVIVDADAERLALTRAARALAEARGLDVETRLSVLRADGRLWIEAEGADGPTDALDELQLVGIKRCGEHVWAALRLPAADP